jgi:ABC-type lipoprotein release transport system permease subunit
MWILQLAWKNLWRNKSRTAITMAAVSFATIISMLAASLKEGIFNNLIKNIVSSYTGHVQVHLKGYQDEQVIENGFVPDSLLRKKISAMPGVDGITSRLESFALISSGETTKGCLVIGIEAQEKHGFTAMEEKITKGAYPVPHENELLLSEGLALKLEKKVGDTVIIIGQGYHGASAAGKYLVKGIVALGSPKLNERLVVMPLEQSQSLFAADSLATSWAVLLHDNMDPDQASKNIAAITGNQLEVLPWGAIMPDIKQHIEADSGNMQFVQLILYFLVGFGIFSTLLIMMAERKIENGMLLALGMSKPRLQYLLLTESMLTVMMGAISGLLVSLPIVLYLKFNPLRISGSTADVYKRFGFEPLFPTSSNPAIFLKQGLTVFVLGLILGAYPIWVIFKMNALKAMKK